MLSNSMNEAAAHNLPDIIDAVRGEGGLIHDLPPDATAILAARHGIYTTTQARDPGSFKEFSRNFEREEAYVLIAQRVGSILARTEQYKEAVEEGILGEALTASFGSIDRIDCEDVHLTGEDVVSKKQKGIVVATRTTLSVPSPEHADKVSVALQALLRTASSEFFYPVTTTGKEDGKATVTIGRLDEHAARSLSRAVEAVVAQDDMRWFGVTLPPQKRTYAAWKSQGETFPPVVDRRLRKAEADYERLKISGSYRKRDDMQPAPKPRIIGTDSAAFFEGIRDIFNGLIHDVRAGGSHLNLEQHPVTEARPLIESGVELKRPKATREDVAAGPMSAQGRGLADKGIDEGRKKLTDMRKHPMRSLTKGISGALSLPGTVLDAAGSAIVCLPAGTEASKEFVDHLRRWRERKELAEAGGQRLDDISHRQRRIQDGLMIWE